MHNAPGELEAFLWDCHKEFRVPSVGWWWYREKATEQGGMRGSMDHAMESKCILQAIGNH